jgi:hypothetical protein
MILLGKLNQFVRKIKWRLIEGINLSRLNNKMVLSLATSLSQQLFPKWK